MSETTNSASRLTLPAEPRCPPNDEAEGLVERYRSAYLFDPQQGEEVYDYSVCCAVALLHVHRLDKPMRDHTLLQAIARVNRPCEDKGDVKKPAGFVLDFVGIFENLEKALAFDSDVVSAVIKNIDASSTSNR